MDAVEIIEEALHDLEHSKITCKEFDDIVKPFRDCMPVKKGKWIWKGEEGDSRFMCSVCQWKENVPTCNGVPDIWQYCPSCGARMEE